MKQLIVAISAILAIFAIVTPIKAQLSLQECYNLGAKNYPLIKQRELIEKARAFSVRNASLGYVPTFSVNGQLTYQADVTKVPSIPGVEAPFPTLSKDQYKVYGDVVAPLYDGGFIKRQKQIHGVNAQVEQQTLEVELYQIKERINQLYFGILLVNGQLILHEYLLEDVGLGLRKTNVAIANGTALKSSGDVLEAELLKARQAGIELNATRAGYIEMLELMINQPLDSTTIFETPTTTEFPGDVNRPELKLYQLQSSAIDLQYKMLNARLQPRLSAFVQAGYGKPGLNMLDNKADSYYLTGVRFSWTLSGFYSRNNDRELLMISREKVTVQRETFIFNNSYRSKQEEAEILKLQQLAAADEQIITLRARVKQNSSVQLENGVIDSNDYLREVNAENQARQSKIVHEIQLLLAQYSLKTTQGI
ncbi:MAG: TolC family protein [Chryseolinea sp.]